MVSDLMRDDTIGVRRLDEKENTYHSLSSSICGRQATIRGRAQDAFDLRKTLDQCLEPEPPMQLVGGEYQSIRRVQFQEPAKPVESRDEAIDRANKDPADATAIAYIGNAILEDAEHNGQPPDEAVTRCLSLAIRIGE